MKTDFINQRITVAGTVSLLKTLVFGVLAAEAWFLSQEIAAYLLETIDKGNLEFYAILIGAPLFFLAIAYIFVRGCVGKCSNILRSARFDILLVFFLGFATSFFQEGIWTEFYRTTLLKFSFSEVLMLSFVLMLIGFLLIARAVQVWVTRKNNTEPFFMSDIEGKNKEDDLLDYAEQATRFAERVFNRGSSDSLVFGIDAPWGIGKSTFVNYCIESWQEKKYEGKVVVYKFNPLRYEDRANLLEKFIDGLVVTLQKSSFAPEIRPLVSRYSRLIKSKGTFSLFGIEFELFPGRYTVDDAFEDLEAALTDFDKKVIVVVDDLDRLSFSAIKDVLFAVKKSFTLPNISYVLCYDTENILALEKDNGDVEKIREFLEKFVNVKISLFLDSEVLSRYVSDNFEAALKSNLQIDPYTRDNLKAAVSVVVDMYKSPDFHHYQSLLGDIRKLKRLINTMVLFEIEKTDFDNSDFDKTDLVHLLLIYINYPSIFRKIYNTETAGRRGFFSAVIPYDDGYPGRAEGRRRDDSKYENSDNYREYFETLTSPHQKFLVSKVFDVSTRLPENRRIDDVPEALKKTLACFNGDGLWTGGRNLEEYLSLIVKLAKPQKRGQYKFYLNARDKVNSGTPIEEVLSQDEFLPSEGEGAHEQFWRITVNTARDLDPVVGAKLIQYLLDHIVDYSTVSIEKIGIGMRHDVDYFLIKLLDEIGWSDPHGERGANTLENIREIAEWIFGDGRHVGHGVVETLGHSNRGVLGLYDLLAFRLFCSADRGGHVFNLTRALSKHADPNAPTEGRTDLIAREGMREISQKVFAMFKEQYITPRVNLFDVINALTLPEVTGNYHVYLEAQEAAGKITKEEKEDALTFLNTRLKSFITYQLGNAQISMGVGCGFYDETGNADGKGIATVFNEYMFGVCFAPKGGQKNFENFLDYLLINFASVFSSRPGREWIPHLNEFTKVLDRAELTTYWRENRDAIKALNLSEKDKTIKAGNYTATYKDDLSEVYSVLDGLLDDPTGQQVQVIDAEVVG